MYASCGATQAWMFSLTLDSWSVTQAYTSSLAFALCFVLNFPLRVQILILLSCYNNSSILSLVVNLHTLHRGQTSFEVWYVQLLSAFPRLDAVPKLVRVFQNPFPRQNSNSCVELQSFHVDYIALQVVFCQLICT